MRLSLNKNNMANFEYAGPKHIYFSNYIKFSKTERFFFLSKPF